VSEDGESEKYPEITYQTVVENFYEPVTNRMWARAVCSATYNDADGEEQTIELEHWLTNISKEQLQEILKRDQDAVDQLGGQVFDSLDEAATYAGVDVETIEDWINRGLVPLEDGSIPKHNLDIFVNNEGNPPAEEIQTQIETQAQLQEQQEQAQQQATPDGQEPTTPDESWLNEIDPTTGLTNREVENMSVEELFNLLLNKSNSR
jgi:hypothetical protein